MLPFFLSNSSPLNCTFTTFCVGVQPLQGQIVLVIKFQLVVTVSMYIPYSFLILNAGLVQHGISWGWWGLRDVSENSKMFKGTSKQFFVLYRFSTMRWWGSWKSAFMKNKTRSSYFARISTAIVSVYCILNIPDSSPVIQSLSWWRIKWKKLSALLALCAENSPVKGQWHGALVFSLICAWISGCVNNREAGDLRHHRAYYDVIVM